MYPIFESDREDDAKLRAHAVFPGIWSLGVYLLSAALMEKNRCHPEIKGKQNRIRRWKKVNEKNALPFL